MFEKVEMWLSSGSTRRWNWYVHLVFLQESYLFFKVVSGTGEWKSGENGMNTLTIEARAVKVWFDEDNLWILLHDGRQLSTPLAYFPRLLKASPEQRQKFEISGGGTGLHWEDLDEDISVPGLLLGQGDLTRGR